MEKYIHIQSEFIHVKLQSTHVKLLSKFDRAQKLIPCENYSVYNFNSYILNCMHRDIYLWI